MRAGYLGMLGVLAGITVIGAVHAQASDAATRYVYRVEQARQEAARLSGSGHLDDAQFQVAVTQLKQALTMLDQPAVEELAEGNPDLRSRSAYVWRDLARLYAMHGDKAAALDALDAAQTEAWFPDQAVDLRKDDAFASLRDEPRFQAMLANLDAMSRLWHARSIAGPYSPQLSEAQRIAGLSLFWSEVKYNFANFDNVPGLDWDQVYLDFLPKVIAAKDTRAYYDVLMQLAPLLHDGHTNIDPPVELRWHFYARLPVDTELVENHVLVTDVRSPTLWRAGIHVGDEILAIDGVEVHRYARERIAPYQSSGTPQDVADRMYTRNLFNGDEDGPPLRLTLRDAGGATHDVSASRRKYSDIQKRPIFVYRMLPNRIAYLSVDEFQNDAGVKAFEQHLPEIMQAKGLILDLRRNGGGNSEHGEELLSYLSERSIEGENGRELRVSPVGRGLNQLTMEWQKVAHDSDPIVLPRSQHFNGPVALLIGPETFSAAEDFVVSFQTLKRGLLVGQRTGGSTGQPMMFDLPGGGTARICAKRETYPDGRKLVGIGIAPDIEVAPTVSDIRAGRDAALERAAEALLKSPIAAASGAALTRATTDGSSR
jgi:C-terminal processing protease CtpA/Prc